MTATAPTLAPENQAAPVRDSERRCLVTGEMLPKDKLIRFVIGPDDVVVPDLAQNLPGRGLWVTATRAAITGAASKNLFAKAAKAPAKTDAGLVDRVAELLRKRCLDFLGLARRSGIAVLGQPQVEAALKARQIAMLLLADDAGSTLPVNPSQDITTSRHFTRDELGAALGHDQLVYIGLKRHALTDTLQASLAHLNAITLSPLTPPDNRHNIE